ncbi:MAG TPA: GvpL/GvpF family gas vesicle protein, partial [Blastocatellia bacterium]
MNAYVYCIALKDELEPLAAPPGIGGAEVGTVEAGKLIAVISDWPQAEIVTTQGDVIAHHKVIDAVLGKSTPIPCRFGAILKKDFVPEFLAANAARFLNLLSLFSGRIEMDIKI